MAKKENLPRMVAIATTLVLTMQRSGYISKASDRFVLRKPDFGQSDLTPQLQPWFTHPKIGVNRAVTVWSGRQRECSSFYHRGPRFRNDTLSIDSFRVLHHKIERWLDDAV